MAAFSVVPIIPDALKALYPGRKSAANLRSIEAGLDVYGVQAGLIKPHRLAHYLAQLAHETAGFVYDREVWGPTAAQQRYDTRTDLGNTPERDGDGKKYSGKTGIQLTGKANVTAFRDWCRAQGLEPPDFVETPDLLNTDPWEGLAPIWYWTVGNPTRKSLNGLADANNIEQITKRINGGLNGYADRIVQYGRIALVLAGYAPNAVKSFQTDALHVGLYDGGVDGDIGPKTRAALHKRLANISSSTVTVAPVAETKSVVPQSVEKEVKGQFNLFGWVGGLFSGGGLGIAGLVGMDWQAIVAIGGVLLLVFLVAVLLRRQLVAAIKDVRKAVEEADA